MRNTYSGGLIFKQAIFTKLPHVLTHPFLLVCTMLAAALPVQAQAPAILWSTNIGARVFAVDFQTNIYSYANGSVIRVDSTGKAYQTNSFCPVPGIARRDAAGNIYFSGTYSAPRDFGGVILTNGMCYIAKYTDTGTLLWARSFSPNGIQYGIRVGDVQFGQDGSIYVGYSDAYSTTHAVSQLVSYDSNGTKRWEIGVPVEDYGGTISDSRIGAIGQTNGYVVGYSGNFTCYCYLSRFDTNGTLSVVKTWTYPGMPPTMETHPVRDAAGNIFNVERSAQTLAPLLVKRDVSGAVLWSLQLGSATVYFTADGDQYGGVHIAGVNGELARYDSDGNLLWSMNLGSEWSAMVTDAQGNRFISRMDGSLLRLANEAITAPLIANSPQSQTLLVGDTLSLSVGATGSTPLRYTWMHDGNPIAGETSSTYGRASVTTADAGMYSVIVSNYSGSVTGAPVLVRVKYVELYAGGQPLTNGTYTFPGPPTLTIRSAYTNGSRFYTLDGSTPSFASTFYSAPFTITHSATVKAMGYSADFSQTDQADTVNVIVLGQHSLTASAFPGGSISLNPPGSTNSRITMAYASTNMVTVTTTPQAGYQFLYWLGDASGTNPTINVPMDSDKDVAAVFGTTLSTTVAGSGQLLLDPPGGIYPYGSVVRLTAVPQPGNYFGFWGNAASGNNNPLYFTVTNANPTVSSIFAATSGTQAALTVQIQGSGQVNVNPPANVYTIGQNITVTATPNPGQSFLNWSGDASGSSSVLNLTMNQSKNITANFTSRPALRSDRPGVEGMTPNGFRLTLTGAAPSVYQIMGSTDLLSWQNLGWVTNTSGEVQFLDTNAGSFSNRVYKAVP